MLSERDVPWKLLTHSPHTTPVYYSNEYHPVLWSLNKKVVWTLTYMFPISMQFSICCSGSWWSVECQGVGKRRQFCCFARRTQQRKLTPCKTPSSYFLLWAAADDLWPLSVNRGARNLGGERFMTSRKNKQLAFFPFLFPPISTSFSVTSSANHLK